jgi:hypothetical protein
VWTPVVPSVVDYLSRKVQQGRDFVAKVGDGVQRSEGSGTTESAENCAEQLSRFFPQAEAVRVPVQVTSLRPGGHNLREATVVEFGGTEHAIFLSTLPLEFADRVRVEVRNKTSQEEGTVVAVQYHEGRKAVAVRFLSGRCDWVTKA